jgi:hypothetical protein
MAHPRAVESYYSTCQSLLKMLVGLAHQHDDRGRRVTNPCSDGRGSDAATCLYTLEFWIWNSGLDLEFWMESYSQG